MPLNKLCSFNTLCENSYNTAFKVMHQATQPYNGCLNSQTHLKQCALNSGTQFDVSTTAFGASGRQTVPDRGATVGSGTGIAPRGLQIS